MNMQPMQIDRDWPLFGMLHEPESVPVRGVLVIFNSGLLHRAGPHRLPVLLGRRVARAGFATLRIDQNGVGDSPRRPGAHHAGVKSDCDAVLAWSSKRYPGVPVILLGLCSGADDVLAAGHEVESLGGIVLLDGYAPRTLSYHLQFWRWRLCRAGAWRRLFRRVLDREPATIADEEEETDLRDWAAPGEMLGRFRSLLQRQVPVLAVFTGAVRDYYSHEGQLAAALRHPPTLTEVMLAHCNHLYELTPHRDELISRIDAWLQSRFPERT